MQTSDNTRKLAVTVWFALFVISALGQHHNIQNMAFADLPATAADSLDAPIDPIAILSPSSESSRPAIVQDDGVTRYRFVSLNVAAIEAIEARGGGPMRFHLFDDITLDAVFDSQVTVSQDQSAWSGTLLGEIDGTVMLVFEDGVLAANIRTNAGMYQIRHAGNNLYAVQQIDGNSLAPCATTHEHTIGRGALIPERVEAGDDEQDDAEAARAAVPTIRVMVVYTDLVRQAVGSASAVNALISLSIAETNQAYASSGVSQRLTLVHKQEVAYVEPFNIDSVLDDLTDPSRGKLAAVRDLRSIYGADLVSMLIEETSFCGLAWVPSRLVPTNDRFGYSVVRHDCAAGPAWSFAHELAHNMSCVHDRDNSDPDFPPIYPYAYGYRYFGAGGLLWRTIMSYAPGARIQYFSNPTVNFDGRATGVAIGEVNEAHNALTLNNTANNVAAYRRSVPGLTWLDFNHAGTKNGGFDTPYSSLSIALANVVSGGTVAIKAGNLAGARTLTTPAVLDAYGSGVILGQ